ncbi:MAG: CcoQ/FixQ family Cbb3-type cytochrome c oxidase assembly chaperone [Bacteroidetes bacterium]|nr:CcoQ/FixQ family Cbb3-type cytochrome c oxidase assembly chaperone [Bacteroidota bacterium]MBK8343161.1 CcoQ/FixQ family Cbb3-type cytochrome c oxidase assembly chaperone [Bacteroidota bacterium]
MNFMHYLSDIDGVSIYPIISLFIFFVFFIGLFYWVQKMDKSSIDEIRNIPLDNSNPNNLNN